MAADYPELIGRRVSGWGFGDTGREVMRLASGIPFDQALLQSLALSSVRSLSVLVVTCCVPCGMELTTRLGMRRDQALGLLRIGYATSPYHVRGTRPDLVLFDPRWRTGGPGFGAPFRPDPPEEWMDVLGPILGRMVPVPG